MIDIVDYCLGSSSCNIAEGVIRDTVDWFAILLQFQSSQMFIARKNPEIGRSTTNMAYLVEGDEVNIPENISSQNTTSENIEEFINNRLGISPNENVPPSGQTRPPLQANFRHVLFFSFQEQNDLTAKDRLFHRQNHFLLQSIKDSLPYFLGVIRENALALEQELQQKRRELHQLERKLREKDAIRGQGNSKAIELISEAKAVGLINPSVEIPATIEESITLLEQACSSTLDAHQDTYISENIDRENELRDKARELQEQIKYTKSTIQAAKTHAQEAEGYTSAVAQQQLRLESIGLFDSVLRKTPHNPSICPLCSHELLELIPSAKAIKNSLQSLKKDLEFVDRDRPKLRDYINNLQSQLESELIELQNTNSALQGIINEQEEAKRYQSIISNRSRAIGRISFWLESTIIEVDDSDTEFNSRIFQTQGRIKELESLLDEDDKNERMESILARIGNRMKIWAMELDLEYVDEDADVRLNLSRGTVVVEGSIDPVNGDLTQSRKVLMSQMGGGENILGYHLIAHLALHKFFVDARRPTPRFLFIDQPTQVYYPEDRQDISSSDETDDLHILDESDREKVQRMFRFIFKVINALAPNFQVVITDHANILESDEFQENIVEIWRDGNALIPNSWIRNS